MSKPATHALKQFKIGGRVTPIDTSWAVGPGVQNEFAVWRSKLAQGDNRARRITNRLELAEWWQYLKLVERDEEALRGFDSAAAKHVGDNPLEVGGQLWPERLLDGPSSMLRVDRSNAVRGWRMWAVRGSTLSAPIRSGPTGDEPHSSWEAGVNVTRSRYCDRTMRPAAHPSPGGMCCCGIRAVQSLTLLRRYNHAMTDYAHAAGAVAEVEVWGLVVGPARGDDWPYTIRAERVQIVGPIHLSSRFEDRADDLAARYGVEVLVGSDQINYVERKSK